MGVQNGIKNILAGHQMIPVVSFNEGDDPLGLMNHLIDLGISCMEVTLRSDYSMDAIELLNKKKADDFLIGAGTVISSNQIDQLAKMEVDFMVSPAYTPELINAFDSSGIAYLPGVATPRDIVEAIQLGLRHLKFFPANLFGGVAALKTYAQVFPQIEFCPTGGIDEVSSKDYLELKNVFAVGGSWFQKNYQTKR